MVAAWLSTSGTTSGGAGEGAAGVSGGGGGGGGGGGVGGGRRARYFLAAVRSRAYLKRGRHEQALRDARVAVAYAPAPALAHKPQHAGVELLEGGQKMLPDASSSSKPSGAVAGAVVYDAGSKKDKIDEGGGEDKAGKGGDDDARRRVDNFSAASRSAAAHALLATALEAVASEANAGDIDLDASFRKDSAALSLHGDGGGGGGSDDGDNDGDSVDLSNDDMFITRSRSNSLTRSRSNSLTTNSITDVSNNVYDDDDDDDTNRHHRHHLDTGRTHASTGGGAVVCNTVFTRHM